MDELGVLLLVGVGVVMLFIFLAFVFPRTPSPPPAPVDPKSRQMRELLTEIGQINNGEIEPPKLEAPKEKEV